MENHYGYTSKVAVALVLFAGLIFFGCDFTRVDEGSNSSVEVLLKNVSEADNQEDAEVAIRNLMNKLEIGRSWRAGKEQGPLDGYTFDESTLEALAEAQVKYNKSKGAQAKSIEQVHTDLLQVHARAVEAGSKEPLGGVESPKVNATAADVGRSLRIKMRQALENPEEPSNALVLAITSREGKLPDVMDEYEAGTQLSPVQATLLGIFIDQNPNPLYTYIEETAGKTATGNPNLSCPCGTSLVAKFEVGSSYKFEAPSGNQNIIQFITATKTGATWASGMSISHVILKGSTDTDVISVNGATSGSFTNKNLYTKKGNHPDLSNIQFCSGYTLPPNWTCKLGCLKSFIMCSLCKGPGACEPAFSVCLRGCHDQGSGVRK